MASTETELKKEELETPKRRKGYELLKTDVLLIISPFLILIGWFIVNLNPVSAYTLDNSEYIPGMTGYQYSPIGLGILMSSIIMLCVGIACHWVKTVSRGEFIILQAVVWSVFNICTLRISKWHTHSLGSNITTLMATLHKHRPPILHFHTLSMVYRSLSNNL